jgi:hypothetical protein
MRSGKQEDTLKLRLGVPPCLIESLGQTGTCGIV